MTRCDTILLRRYTIGKDKRRDEIGDAIVRLSTAASRPSLAKDKDN
jgi:hypothetical protein